MPTMFEKPYFLLRGRLAARSPLDNASHLREAVAWLYRAQDATPDGGVSHSYEIGRGWLPSYPETTGYIVPTLLAWHALTGDAEARRRALAMADWELAVQLENGAIPSLTTREPVVFDTGQVIFGWIAAHQETGDVRYRAAAVRGGEWLVRSLDAGGTWSSFGNPGSAGLHTYNARVAWALLALWKGTGDGKFRDAMSGFLDWALAEEEGRGWFRHNCLNDDERPLLHTIAYTAQGLLESGLLTGDDRCVAASVRTSDALARLVADDGRMAGRFDRDWRPSAPWSCLTGMAQTAIVWQRLDRLRGTSQYADVTRRVLGFLKRTQDMSTSSAGVRGGITGSFPINGAYGTYRVLNWATKFYIDALLLAEYPESNFTPF